MGCMTHYCPDCETEFINNNPLKTRCPECGRYMGRTFDEEYDPYPDEYEQEDDYNEDEEEPEKDSYENFN